MDISEIQEIEFQLLLQTLQLRYRYDFSHYATVSLKRRINKLLMENSLEHYSDLIPFLIHNPARFLKLLDTISVPVTELFRDPEFFTYLRSKIISLLKKSSFINVWIAGCATGEEVFSLAILLKEMKCYNKSTLIATDFAPSVVNKAKEGSFPEKHFEEYENNYLKAGGSKSLSDYVQLKNKHYYFKANVRKNITFQTHNLVHDKAMNNIHLISCRNVLIYFDNVLQNDVISLFEKSLVPGGFLCLGTKETMRFTSMRTKFKIFHENLRIYQKQNNESSYSR